jgi:hypothetical protein
VTNDFMTDAILDSRLFGASKLALTREFGNAKLASPVKASFDATVRV